MTPPRRSNHAKRDDTNRIEPPRWTPKLVSSFKDSLNSVPDRIFDRMLGVSTREIIVRDGSVFTSGGDNCAYDGSQWLPVRRVLRDLAPKSSDVLVDLGSGKGKVLLIAGRLPYRRVVGVEVDEELSEGARRNIKQAQSWLRAQDVDSITASVLDWPIPDETTIVFMFNPFIGQTFRAAVGKIIDSYDRRPRTLHIVYLYPWEHDWLLSTGRVVVDDVRPGNWLARPRWWQNEYVIVSYRVIGISDGSQSGSFPHSLIRSHKAIRHWSGPNGHRFTIAASGWETRYSRF